MDDLLELTRQAEARHFWFRGFRWFIQPILDDVAGGRTDLRLIDCGCGVGQNLALLERHGRASGFDLAESGLKAAGAWRHAIVRADLNSIPFTSNFFDVATSFDVLQCVGTDEAAVREMARVVRPGGAVVLTVAAFDFLRGDHAEVWQEFRRYTPATVRRLVESAGLRAERVEFLFASTFPLMLAVRVMQRLTRPLRGLQRDTDITVPAAPVNSVLTWMLKAEAALSRRLPMPIGSSLRVVARKPAGP